MKRIQKRLDEGESIVMSVRQSRIKPGGTALINPNTIPDGKACHNQEPHKTGHR